MFIKLIFNLGFFTNYWKEKIIFIKEQIQNLEKFLLTVINLEILGEYIFKEIKTYIK